MTRLYGRAPRGRRLLAKAPFGHWKTTTFVAALRRGGLDEPMVLDGPMTGQAFLAYVEQAYPVAGPLQKFMSEVKGGSWSGTVPLPSPR